MVRRVEQGLPQPASHARNSAPNFSDGNRFARSANVSVMHLRCTSGKVQVPPPQALLGKIMNIHLSLTPLISLIAGVLILIMPKLLNFIVAIYLILVGLIGIFGTNWFPLR